MKIEMLRRGYTAESLAKEISTTQQVVSNVMAGRNRSKPTLSKIEDALRIPIWSSLEEFAARKIVPSETNPPTNHERTRNSKRTRPARRRDRQG